jgi:Flp pilus assembly protein TadD
LIRQQRKSEAVALLERAEGGGGSAELSYLFGLALIDNGQQRRGMRVLEKALVRAPGDRDLLLALASQAQASGVSDQAQRYLQRLAAINPDDPALSRAQ